MKAKILESQKEENIKCIVKEQTLIACLEVVVKHDGKKE